jgi:DNA-binding SARP family transcriptional activator
MDCGDPRASHHRVAIQPLPSATEVLEFRILGPLEVVGDGIPVRLGGPKQRATLAILLLRANRVVPIERLADELYAGAPPVTAVTQVQRQISELRKALGDAHGIETRAPGYVIRVFPGQLDLSRFERQTEEAGHALAAGHAKKAADLLSDALALWRGAALADLTYESFAQAALGRLEEIRLVALEQRIEAELALGRHAELIAELAALVAEHPLREILCGRLMVALYRSGRQTESLEVYRRTRDGLVERFGIEPTPALRDLERAILTQDSSLQLARASTGTPGHPASSSGPVLALPSHEREVDHLLAVAEPLARRPARELILALLVADQDGLPRAASVMNARRASYEGAARTAVFTTANPADDIARLVASHDIDLVLVDAAADVAERLPDDLVAILERSPCDVGILTGSAPNLTADGSIFVPFGGGEHDWAALELAGWLASATGSRLRLVGTRADPRRGLRDSSRLLADASLAVQRVVGVETEPVLTEPSEDGLLAAVEPATMVVVGISEHWRRDGIGASRRAIVRGGRAPTLLVHRGLRPGGLAPHGSRTRFSWTLGSDRG